MNQEKQNDLMRWCVRKTAELKDAQREYRAHWADIAEYILPRYGRYLRDEDERDYERGRKKNQHVVSSSAEYAVRTFAAGVQNGLTSKARPWFRLYHPDRELNEDAAVREWLSGTRDAMLACLARTNFYDCVHNAYRELGAFGTACMLIEEDDEAIVRFRTLTIGEYYLAANSKNEVDLLVRRVNMTARQLVQEFGPEHVSDTVRREIEQDRGEDEHTVWHVVRFNPHGRADAGVAADFPWQSVYYEENSGKACEERRSDAQFLRISGYKSKPFVAPRWEPISNAVYGNSPGMTALPDVKMLEAMEQDKLLTLEKHVKPPMNAPASLKREGGTIVAGGINFIPDMAGTGMTLSPAYQTSGQIQEVAAEIEQVKQRVNQIFYVNLFLAVTTQDKRMTATEVAKRSAETMAQIGPAVERVELEMLRDCIDRTFEKCLEVGAIPPPPPALSAQMVEIEYLGVLAQAQKMADLAAIEEEAQFMGMLAQLNQEVLDKFDADQAADEYHERKGAPPRIVRSDEQVEKIRAERAKQQMMQQRQQEAAQAVQMAQTLGKTPTGGDTALGNIIGGMAGTGAEAPDMGW